nr:MAG TPA: 30S ribosomal protein S2 [Bacteriophage sp.]DAP87964.1 MAG TPA: 30S ribosomal protein S2 [Caudoviricetes sp.]
MRLRTSFPLYSPWIGLDDDFILDCEGEVIFLKNY